MTTKTHQAQTRTVSTSEKQTRRVLSYAGTYLFWMIGSVLTLLPIYWIIVVSSRKRIELMSGKPNFAPTFFSSFHWKNFTDPFVNGDQTTYLLNSVFIATTNSLLVVVLAVMATYALSRYRLGGADNVFFWTITNRMAPPAAFLLPLYLLYTKAFKFNDWFLYDTHLGLILIYCVFNLPFAIWLMKGIMDGIPPELDEAVMVDGGTLWTVLTRIIVPLAAPGIAITGLLTWVFAWNEYLFAATLAGGKVRTVTGGLAEFVTVTGSDWGQMAAVAVISLLPALIFLSLVQKYIVMGLTFGAVKG
jgi:ABC-type glycerol-3-phosphate transport system permease component